MEPLHELEEFSQSTYANNKEVQNTVRLPAKTYSFCQRKESSRQLSTQSLPSNPANRHLSISLSTPTGQSPPSLNGGPLSHHYNLQQQYDHLRQPSLLLLPLAAQLNLASLPVTSHKQFTSNNCGRSTSQSISSISRSLYCKANNINSVNTRTQSITGSSNNGTNVQSYIISDNVDTSKKIQPSNNSPHLSPIPSPLNVDNSLSRFTFPFQSLPLNDRQSGIESATSSSRLHSALLVSLMILLLIGFVLTKLRDPCEDLLYVAEAEASCSVIANLAFSIILLIGALFALLVYFFHAIGQFDYRSWNAKRQVFVEMLVTSAVAISLLFSIWALFQFTPAIHSMINASSAVCAAISSVLLLTRVALLKREHRMLHTGPLKQRTTSVDAAITPLANTTTPMTAFNSNETNKSYRKSNGSDGGNGFFNHGASLRSSFQSASGTKRSVDIIQTEKDRAPTVNNQTSFGKFELDELRTVDLEDEVFQV